MKLISYSDTPMGVQVVISLNHRNDTERRDVYAPDHKEWPRMVAAVSHVRRLLTPAQQERINQLRLTRVDRKTFPEKSIVECQLSYEP